MKITAVEINNIASIEGCYHINFESEPLNSIGLFAITGATGSGKSTILDAICLALYNKTPRLAPITANIQILDTKDKTISNKDVKTLLRKGAVQGHVKVDFIGIDEKNYQAEWNIRRGNNRITGTIQNEEIVLHQISDGTVFPENRKTLVLAEIERLIGLKFEQFTKSVILAQGEFTSFLKADDNNRADILEKLTGTDIYSKISKQIFENFRDKRQEIDTINTKLEMFQLFSDDELSDLHSNSKLIKQNIEEKSRHLTIYKQTENWFKIYKELELSISNAEIILQEKHNNLKVENERIKKFKLLEHFQEIRQTTLEFKKLNSENEFVKDSLTERNLELKDNDRSLKKIEEELNHLKLEKQNLQQIINNNQKLYSEARELDVNIKIENNFFIEKNNDFIGKEKKLNQLQNDLKENRFFLNKVTSEIDSLNFWFKNYTNYQNFIAQESLVYDLLKSAENIHLNLPKDTQIEKDYSSKIVLLHDQLDDFKSSQVKFEIEINNLDTEISNKKKTIKLLNFQELKARKTTFEIEIESLSDALNFFKNISEIKTSLHNNSITLVDNESNLNQKKQEIVEITNRKQIAISKKDTLRVVLDRLNLEQSNDVISLRENLIPEESCPVCGSLDHPFINHSPLEKVANDTQIEFNEVEKLISKLITEEGSIFQSEKYLTEQISLLRNQKAIFENELIEQREVWQTKNNLKKYSSLKDEEISISIQSEISKLNNDLSDILKTIDFYEKTWNEIQNLQNLVIEKVNENKVLSNVFVSKNEEYNQLIQNKGLISQRIAERRNKLVGDFEKLNKIFGNEIWKESWLQNQNLFNENLNKISRLWKQNKEQTETKSEFKIKVQAEIQTIEKQILNEQSSLKDLHIEIDKNNLSLTKNIEKRKTYFEGQTIEEVEIYWSNLLEKTQVLESQKQEKRQKINNSNISLQANLDNLQETLFKNTTIINQNLKIIEKWLSENDNLNVETILHFTDFSPEWMQKESIYIQNLNLEISKQETLVNDKKQDFLKHKESKPNSISEIKNNNLLMETEIKLMELNDHFSSIKYDLESDSVKRKSHKEFIDQRSILQNNAAKWSQLNDLIGSADGAKFRKIAQEYTLDILLRYANIQLEKINNRYILERIPSTLSLQVIDNDMACEIRSVHSLSGGESFLISLGLALALSSLSSSKMNIQSLFIDEGFGTLDAQTLAIAMDALESLQNQGKKVGVISHVQEMTERIPVKIHVEKLGNGRSSIEIQSF